MNEAPMKIWWSPYERLADEINDNSNEIPYIRADIVDDLIKALIAIGAGQGDPKEFAIQSLENYMEENK